MKEEWEERQRLKKEKAKEKEKEKEKKEEGDKDKDKKEASDDVKEKKSSVAVPSPASGSSTPSIAAHPRYSLHRDFFASEFVVRFAERAPIYDGFQCVSPSIESADRQRRQRSSRLACQERQRAIHDRLRVET